MPTELPAPAPVAPARERGSFILSGRMVAGGFIGFFLVVAGVNATMMTVALRTMPGVDVKSAYETSQRFNDEIARMQAQDARGWKAELDVSRKGPDAALLLDLRDRDGAPLRGLAVTARLERPATHQQDHAGAFAETGEGRYALALPGIEGGGWSLALEARRGEETVFVSRSRIVLKP